MTRSLFISTALAATAAGAVAFADAPRLDLPIACELGVTCFIEDYVDAQAGEGMRDHACGLKSREGHRGTDIALTDFAAMEAGVPVLAAADGTVAATRDGMADIAHTPDRAEAIRGRECGNAVRIDHGDGYQTLYCHLRRGSIRVQSGDRVRAGDLLAEVGLSGQTNYPHVHIGVLRDGQHIDPFAPEATGTCGPAGTPMWRTDIPYDRTGLFTAGFSTAVPSFDDVKSGAARVREAAPGDPLVAYAHAFHAEAGDVMRFSAEGPEGPVFARDVVIEKSQPSLFRAFGKRAPPGGWPAGDYRASVRLMRDGRILAVRHADIAVR